MNWPTLWEEFRGRTIRALLVIVPIIAMIIFPIGIFAGARWLEGSGRHMQTQCL